MIQDYKIIFVHGFSTSSKWDWYPNISKELKKLKVDFTIPDLPNSHHPNANEWIETIYNQTKRTKKPIILIGHSLGTRVVLLFLYKYAKEFNIVKVFLIAPLSNNTIHEQRRGGKLSSFFKHKIDLEKIKKFVKEFIVIHSEDDESVSYNQGEELAKDLDAKLITFKNRGHFSHSSNYSYILKILKEELP